MVHQDFNVFIEYIESLAVRNKDLQHLKDGVKHFTRLDSDELDTSLQSRVGFPVLCLDRYSATLSGEGNNMQKRRGIMLMFLEHVGDPKNYTRIHEVWSNCESIADDFVNQINADIQGYKVPGMFDIDLSSVEYELAANKSLSLYGVVVTFTVSSKFCLKPRIGKFD